MSARKKVENRSKGLIHLRKWLIMKKVLIPLTLKVKNRIVFSDFPSSNVFSLDDIVSWQGKGFSLR